MDKFVFKLDHSSASSTKWPNKLKQFAGCCRPIFWVCLTILWGWRLKGLKTHFVTLYPKAQYNIFSGKSSAPVLNIYDAATSYKKTWKVPCVDFSWNLKTSWASLAQKLQNKLSPQKFISINFELLCYGNFIQKQQKIHTFNFHKTWKTSPWVHCGPLLPQNLKKRSFQKIHSRQF